MARQIVYDELHRAEEGTEAVRLAVHRVAHLLSESRHFDLAAACAEQATVLLHSLASLDSYVVPDRA